MNVEFKFRVKQEVLVEESNEKGFIDTCAIDAAGPRYLVQFENHTETYKHLGFEVTFSVKVSAQEYLSIAANDEDNEDYLNTLLQNASLSACPQVLTLLHKAHSEFEKAISESFVAQIRSLHTPNSGINNPADTTSDTDTDPIKKKEV